MEDRVVELEIKVAYQDRLIADLDEVVRAFADRVQALEHELAELRDTVVATQEPIEQANEPPPHY